MENCIDKAQSILQDTQFLIYTSKRDLSELIIVRLTFQQIQSHKHIYIIPILKYIYIYIYVYTYVFVCICVCASMHACIYYTVCMC